MKTLSSLELNGSNGQAAAAPADAPAPLPPALSAPPTFETALHVLRRRWLLVASLGLVAAALGAAVAWYLTPGKYAATATVHLLSRNPRARNSDADEFTNFQRTQLAALKSYDVLSRLIVKPEIRDLGEMQAHQGSELEWLQKDIDIDAKTGPELLRVTLTGDNPDDVAKILNALIQVYKEKYDGDEMEAIDKQIEDLNKQFQNLDQKTKNNPQLADGPGGDLKSLELKQADLQQKVTLQQIQLAQLQSQIRRAEADKADLERKKAKPELLVDQYELLKEVNQTEEIRPLRDLIRQKDLEIAQWMRTSPNPLPSATKSKIDALKAEKAIVEKEIETNGTAVVAYVREILEKRAVQKIDDSIADIAKDVKLKKEEANTLNSELLTNQTALEDVRLQASNQRNRELNQQNILKTNEFLRARLNEDIFGLMQSKTAASRVEFKEHAQPPQARQIDKKVKFAGGAAVAMFGLVALGVFLSEFRQRRIYTQEDVARGLGVRVVGTLPYQSSRSSPKAHEQMAMLEASDALRTVLLQAGRNDGVRVVMVTSAGDGEGKTSLASQLAASLGRAGRRTLLIDGDLRKPAAHAQFNVPLTPGFAEALRGEIDPDDAIKATSVLNLSVLPAGQCDLAAIQALAQDELQTMFFHLKEEYEFVILDASPVLPVADALVIGQHADAVLFSVLRDVSKLPLVYEAQQRLEALGIRMLGAVVSGERPRTYAGKVLLTAAPPKK